MAPPKAAESSALLSSPASGDGSSLTSIQPAGWPTITSHPANKPSGQKRKMVDDGHGLKRCELSSYMVIGSRTLFKTNSASPLFLPLPARRISAPGRRHLSAYRLSYQSLFFSVHQPGKPGRRFSQMCQRRVGTSSFSRGLSEALYQTGFLPTPAC